MPGLQLNFAYVEILRQRIRYTWMNPLQQFFEEHITQYMIQIMRSWTKVRGRLARWFDLNNNSSYCSSWCFWQFKQETYFCRIVLSVIFKWCIKYLLILHKLYFTFCVPKWCLFSKLSKPRFHTWRINFSKQEWSDSWTWKHWNR